MKSDHVARGAHASIRRPGLPQAPAADRHYPLSGITVVDLSHVYNGPYATFLMAMAGAEVIKVEPFQR